MELKLGHFSTGAHSQKKYIALFFYASRIDFKDRQNTGYIATIYVTSLPLSSQLYSPQDTSR